MSDLTLHAAESVIRIELATPVDARSHAAFARAKQLMPGGVNSPARAFGGVGGEPMFIERGEGRVSVRHRRQSLPRLHRLVGPDDPRPRPSARWSRPSQAAAARGTSFGAPTEAESELAELIIAAVPSIEKVRLVNSGTEATMSAIRLARGFTGRDVIVKFAGNYHGHVDSLLVAAGSSAATLGVPNSPGVTAGTTAGHAGAAPTTIRPAWKRRFAEHGARIAGVILEPVVGNMGCVVPDRRVSCGAAAI